METIAIRDEFIKLGQAMKLARLVDSGVEAKLVIQDGKVKVNGEICLQRGKKLYGGDIFEFEGKLIKIEN
ncbi:RNA-binding S4 domain-containing protein [Fusibacillus kribbianus]|uniref:RNA-binding S4 domain-containing protein n=1 Tax=Fusibacillus kribbianus TaxID=3044208 RepID=A0AAP4BAX3_9FIRM|nr:RNA-binding S4 domain-containing protein [Ruminococcus sp. YH-rum2234]MDI9242690.1 RNA-binding S4 domain-containing protein [Ruminococcus sp. YH-rum2234]